MKVEKLEKYKDNLYTALSRDLSEFEKNFLLIASGILAFSITFIKDIVEIESAIWLNSLFVAWGFIICAVGLMMYTFLKSSSASNKLWKTADDFIIKHKLYDKEQTMSDDLVHQFKTKINLVFYNQKGHLKVLRHWAVALFLIGISCLSFYVFINLRHENNLTKTLPENHTSIIDNRCKTHVNSLK